MGTRLPHILQRSEPTTSPQREKSINNDGSLESDSAGSVFELTMDTGLNARDWG